MQGGRRWQAELDADASSFHGRSHRRGKGRGLFAPPGKGACSPRGEGACSPDTEPHKAALTSGVWQPSSTRAPAPSKHHATQHMLIVSRGARRAAKMHLPLHIRAQGEPLRIPPNAPHQLCRASLCEHSSIHSPSTYSTSCAHTILGSCILKLNALSFSSPFFGTRQLWLVV